MSAFGLQMHYLFGNWYREYSEEIIFALNMGCSVVNMDTSHLYAACKLLDIECEYYAVVSDSINHDSWDNSLEKAINSKDSIVTEYQTNLIKLILDKIC
jgi:purine-nucleoside phosphorylase